MALARRSKTWGTKPADAAPRSAVSATELPREPADAAAPQEQMAPGDVVVNRYLLTSLLGEGGMGAIWLARDLRLDIDVALKFIHREIATEQTSERLLQEARAVARLDHASIVRVFDFGESETGEPFMAMEVLRGELLSEVLDRKGRLAAPNAVCTLLPVASAVAAAHAKGIVHRDLKPENILLVTDEESGSVIPKVLDFGIATLRSKGRKAKRITENDAIVGTPDYMPPEQASGLGDVDSRADVWALCVVLYEAITGHRPFDAETPTLVLISIATKAPTPTTEYGAGDDALWTILAKGLEKEASERYQTMRELGTALARWAVDNGADTDVAGTSLAVHWLTERARRPLSEIPPAPEITPVEAASPPPAAAPQKPAAPAQEPRTGGTWPPRTVARAPAIGASLRTLAEPVSLPPGLARKSYAWLWTLIILGVAGGAVYGNRHTPEVRSVLEGLGLASAAPSVPEPVPSATPAPRATEQPAHSTEPTATNTAAPPRPPVRPPVRKR